FTGRHFWARGYCVSTVGLDEQMIRTYIKNQEREEKRQEQLGPRKK
ncbi:transposase, partial [Thiolapillus sp.]